MRDAALAGRSLEPFFHVCALFNSREEEHQVLGPFFKEALEHGEQVLNIVDPTVLADHRQRFRDLGIDEAGAMRSGQLQLLTWHEAYFVEGSFDPERMLATLHRVLAEGLAGGYPRLRAMAHMGWALADHPGADRLIEYETQVNQILARSRQPGICVYDLNQLSGAMMMDILRTHPLTLVGGVVHENPFYTPPERFLRELRSRRRGDQAVA